MWSSNPTCFNVQTVQNTVPEASQYMAIKENFKYGINRRQFNFPRLMLMLINFSGWLVQAFVILGSYRGTKQTKSEVDIQEHSLKMPSLNEGVRKQLLSSCTQTARQSVFLRIQVRAIREQSNERSGTRLKTESETGERLSPYTPYGSLTGVRGLRASRLRLLRHALPIFLLIFRKKPTVLQSIMHASPFFLLACKTCICKNICSAHTRVYIPSRRPFILLTQIKYLIILSA